MELFTLLFLIVLFYIFILPAYKVWKAVNAAKRQAREMNDAFRRAAGFNPDERQERTTQSKQKSGNGGWTAPLFKPKKIAPEVGEYVKFTEIENETDTPHPDRDRHTTTPVSEQQVEDTKWEDL